MGNTCGAETREQVAEHAEDAAEQVREVVQDAVENVQEKAEQAQESAAAVVESIKEGAADAAEAAEATMTAAVAAVTGVLIVEFADGKGNAKSVEFKSRDLDFTPAKGGAGCCCRSAPKACVVVSRVEKNRQADKLGVKKGWAMKAVNGTEVTGLEQARKLLEDGKAKLSEA